MRLAEVIGPQVLQLRPQTKLAEMLKWAALADADSMDFAVVFEPELRMDLAEFLEYSEQATFRDGPALCQTIRQLSRSLEDHHRWTRRLP
jgi:hypothetical protein